MTPRFLAIAIALAASNVAFAQNDAAAVPKTMLGFFKPGMRLGVSSIEGTTSVILRTYTEDDYKVARDLAKRLGASVKSAASVAETNASVRTQLQEYVSRLDLPDASIDGIMIMPIVRISLGTVVAAGDDYLLLDLDGQPKRKRIIPKASIGTIYLDANPIRFFDPGARSRAGRGG